MKKLVFLLAPLLAVSFLTTSCNKGPSYNDDCEYLTFNAEQDSSVTYSINESDITDAPEFQYSTDMQNWQDWELGTVISIKGGHKIYIRNIKDHLSCEQYTVFFDLSGKIAASGDITSLASDSKENMRPYEFRDLFRDNIALVRAPKLPAMTLAKECYSCMFCGCSYLKEAPDLPATTLAENCYDCMFYGCVSLAKTPTLLPAMTLANYCYYQMFAYCFSLKDAPALPATTLADECYFGMFQDCISLVKAPALPAMTLTSRCYQSMFENCYSLKEAPNLPADTISENCYSSMFRSCYSLTSVPKILPAMTLKESCYVFMFFDCTNLTTAPELPATELAKFCYDGMFSDCYSLEKAPYLPATTFTEDKHGCYAEMFSGCRLLSEVKVGFSEFPNNDECYTSDWLRSAGVLASNPTFYWKGTTEPKHSPDTVPIHWTIINE